MAEQGPLPQDELAQVREQLESLCQQRRQEAAKQEQNDRLMNILDEDIHRLAAEKQRLIEEHAKWLEAQATGGRPRQQVIIWVKACQGGPTVQVAINDGRLDVARDSMSAAPKLRSYWAHFFPVAKVEFFSPATDTNGLPTLLHTSDVDQDGYASLDLEKLAGLGQARNRPVLLKFGVHDVLPTWSWKTRWRLIAVVMLAVTIFVFRQSILDFFSLLWRRPEPPAGLPA